MGIAVTIRDYLEELDVVYDIVDHPVRMTSIGIAHQAHPRVFALGRRADS